MAKFASEFSGRVRIRIRRIVALAATLRLKLEGLLHIKHSANRLSRLQAHRRVVQHHRALLTPSGSRRFAADMLVAVLALDAQS